MTVFLCLPFHPLYHLFSISFLDVSHSVSGAALMYLVFAELYQCPNVFIKELGIPHIPAAVAAQQPYRSCDLYILLLGNLPSLMPAVLL